MLPPPHRVKDHETAEHEDDVDADLAAFEPGQDAGILPLEHCRGLQMEQDDQRRGHPEQHLQPTDHPHILANLRAM